MDIMNWRLTIMDDIYTENRLTRFLDSVYKDIMAGKILLPPCIPIEGPPGSGKTSIIRSWLKHNKFKYIEIDATTICPYKFEYEYLPIDESNNPEVRIVNSSELTDLITPKKRAVDVYFSPDMIDEMNKDTIIFIDNYDRASLDNRMALMQLVKDLVVIDPREENTKKLKRINALMFMIVFDSSINHNEFTIEEKQCFGL